MGRRFRIVGLVLAGLLLLGAAGFVVWAESTNPVMEPALAALNSDGRVIVENEEWIVFRPADTARPLGVIFYPGGRVEPSAYAPLLRALAEDGYLAVIVPMPLNLAVLGSQRAGEVMVAFPEIESWVLAGHSLGGAMAAAYVYGNPDAVAGLVLYGSYPAGNNSLASLDLPVLSIYGSEDGGAEAIAASRELLPAGVEMVVIEGGNHAQFGYYGIQTGDGVATIGREAQQAETRRLTLDLLAALTGR